MSDRTVFRIDDVSLNTNPERLVRIVEMLQQRAPSATVMLAVSPAVANIPPSPKALDAERLFPSIWHTESDHRVFFNMDRIGVPEIVTRLRRIPGIRVAGHGLVHVDHRLLKRSAQELSIVMCCHLLQSSVFVPPFNKWNAKTEAICAEFGIQLVRYEEGWRHLAFHKFDPKHPLYYVHTHDLTDEQFHHQLS